MMKFNQNYHYIHHLFTLYCLCLYLSHRQYLPTAHHFPITLNIIFHFLVSILILQSDGKEAYHRAGIPKVLNEYKTSEETVEEPDVVYG